MMNLDNHSLSKRVICSLCLRPLSACICHCIQTIDSAIEVVILQHPSEKTHAKGSARLLHLCLPNSRLIIENEVGNFCRDSVNDFDSMLNDALFCRGKTPVLLYPNDEYANEDALGNSDFSLNGNSIKVNKIDHLRLVIIDATWRMSRQMLYKYPCLQNLSRIGLKDVPHSQYRIRHADKSEQLSSLEACAYALMQLENNAEKYTPLLKSFDVFVDMQIQFGALNLQRESKI